MYLRMKKSSKTRNQFPKNLLKLHKYFRKFFHEITLKSRIGFILNLHEYHWFSKVGKYCFLSIWQQIIETAYIKTAYGNLYGNFKSEVKKQ